MEKITRNESKKTIGKTFTGEEFDVPQTFDFLINMSKLPLTFFESLALLLIAFQISLFFFSGLPSFFYILLFSFWRFSYNFFLGYILNLQSKEQYVIKKFSPLFNEGSQTRSFIKKQLSMKMGPDYDFEKVPLAYNSWLLFRALVDVILLNDFATYFLCVFSFFEVPETVTWKTAIIYFVGVCLCIFNWFIKADALRVVKDFAWYWGDFFFVIDSELTFDGVFQMAPHPMYSIGYLGYYGMSLISQSYVVLYVSLGAHMCQFLFLGFVENPHIDKIYNSISNMPSHERFKQRSILYEGPSAYFRKDLIVFKNFDFYRSADVFTAVLIFYTCMTYFMHQNYWFYICQSVLWRVNHSFILGILLKKQSEERLFTKHYLKHGFTAQDAFSNWKGLYNLSMTMTHVSFLICSLKLYEIPESFFYGAVLLRHTLGALLIMLHVWTSVEVYEVIGDFGWFYGDFFISNAQSQPEYTGIYRFVNNPEKVMGHAGQYGLSLITANWIVFAIALFSQCMTFFFIYYIERPHMKKLYGSSVRKEAGFETALAERISSINLVKKKVSQLTDNAETKINETIKEVKEKSDIFVERVAKPKVSELIDGLQEKTIKIAKPAMQNENLDPSKFKIHTAKSALLGQPIEVTWEAPEDHSEKDWIGIYLIEENNKSGGMTTKSSKGKWHLVGEGTSGVIRFSSDKIPWKPGTYEFRYHFDYLYSILATSEPIEIVLGGDLQLAFDNQITSEVIERQLIVIWSRIFGKHVTNEDDFWVLSSSTNSKQVERKAKGIMIFIQDTYGIELSPSVLKGLPNVSHLSKHIHEARTHLMEASDKSTSKKND